MRSRDNVGCTATAEAWTADYFVVDQVSRPGGAVTKVASFAVAAGRPGAQPV